MNKTEAEVVLLVLLKGRKVNVALLRHRELLFLVPFLSVSYGSPAVLPVEL